MVGVTRRGAAVGEGDGVEPLLSVDRVSQLLGLDHVIVSALVNAGVLPGIRIGSRWRIPPTAIAEFYRRVADGEVPLDLDEAVIAPYLAERNFGVVAKPRKWRGLTPGVRFAVLQRCNFRCSYCGRSAKDVTLHIDHIFPRSKGGTDEPSNLTAACRDCNLGKHAKPLESDQ